ncbi:MAG: methyltransferase domain-containing protein [Candidatus Sericytochromatia bacterium]
MSQTNQAQIDYWNGKAGEKWAAMQARLDQMLTNVTKALKARAGTVSGQRVLDIGCGTGETCTIWLAGGAKVTGLDVSAPMLAVAKERTGGKAILVEADASEWRSETPFDLAVSRFGVMFFEAPDPAFANIAANLRPGGRLLFACWRSLAENKWASLPVAAIRDLLPESPPPVPHAPGPFALADKDRLGGILERAGFADVTISPLDFPVCLSSAGLEDAVNFTLQMGPAGSALAEASNELKAEAAERLKAALAPSEREGQVTLEGAIWLVEAYTS